jgi:protocatechuate 3,4-dioxygenase beta subunit
MLCSGAKRKSDRIERGKQAVRRAAPVWYNATVKLFSFCMSVTLALSALLVSASPGAQAPPAADSSLTLVTPEEPGTRLIVHGVVVGPKGQPIAGARLRVYQTDVTGRYTPERPMDEPHARLAGWLRTDAQGRFVLRTIRPGGYRKPVLLEGRKRKIPAHIHLDITAAGYAHRKLQAVFADDALLQEPYWKDWVVRLNQPVLVLRGSGETAVTDLEVTLQPSRP